jgi:hypothetical protein
MIVYNVTFQVDPSIEQEWLLWMEQQHIPEMLATQLFQEAKLLRVRTEEGTITGSYAIQYLAESQRHLETYFTKHSAALRAKTHQLFGEKALAFRTQLEVLSLQS